MQLVHLASRLYGTPLLIARPKLDVILSVLGSRIGLPDLDMAMPLPMPRQSSTSGQAGIAVIPVVGTLVRRSMGIEAASGLMSYGEIEARLDAALADPQVAGILLDLDSPGGEASGVFELAERIRAASTIKPIWAHANDAAYSAAFAIAAACQRLTLSQTAGVGSIGVIALHVDQSVKDAKDGLNYTAVFAGSHKNDFSPHEPLSPQAITALQTEVDRLYDIFVNQVGQMRGLDPDAVRATEAGLFYGEQAVAAGLEFSTAADNGQIKTACLELLGLMEDGLTGEFSTGVHVLCSTEFFRALTTHKEVKTAYQNWQQGAVLINDMRSGFSYSGITFEEYRGQASFVQADGTLGSRRFIAAGEAHAFPVGTVDTFATYFAPADFNETVNTIGQPLYAKQEPRKFDRGTDLHTQSNPLPMCHRPGVLIKLVAA